jgi:hypothetical protein
VKTARPDDDPQDFRFAGSFGPFDLDDDASDATLPDSITFSGLRAGAYSVSETLIAGWRVVEIVCDDTK